MSVSGHFAMLIVNHFTNANVYFQDFIIKYVTLKHEKVKMHKFMQKEGLFPMKENEVNSLQFFIP